MNKQLHSLMQKEMTRKEFLGVLGLGVASVLGFSGVVRLLSAKEHHSGGATTGGYGSSSYGR